MSGLGNCRVTIMAPDGWPSQTHRPGCGAMHALRRAGWQVVRIYRAQPGEHPEAACCRPHEDQQRRAA
jgi:hypothetical protein